MKHQSIEAVREAADVRPAVIPMTRRERLERWAERLEAAGVSRIPSIHELEFLPRAQRAAVRVNGSALSVAYADPLLREAGLTSDRYGDARSFFDLSEADAHRLLCSCRNGAATSADRLAAEVRQLARRSESGLSALWLPAAAMGAALAPLAMYLFA